MSSNDQMIKLYSQEILRLTTDIPFTERLNAPDSSVKKRSPLCGSSVTVDICIQDGRIKEFGQDVKACALGQASAAIFGASVIGRTEEEILKLQTEMTNMLRGSEIAPSSPFDKYAILMPASAYPNRHASIMLPIDATLAAIHEK